MDLKGIKLTAVLLIAVLMFGLLLGGKYVYGKVTSDQPLFKSFQNVPEVTGVQILKNTKKEMEILVTLAEVDDLAVAYHNLAQMAQPVAGDRECRLILTDARNEILAKAYYDIHYLIQESIATGAFAAMADKVEERIDRTEINRHRVVVGNEYVFVQLHHDGQYLYEIIPRQEKTAVTVMPADTVRRIKG
jgi:hypothetical protein